MGSSSTRAAPAPPGGLAAQQLTPLSAALIWGEQQGWRGLRGLAEGLAELTEGLEEGPTSRVLWERRGPSAVGSREERRRGEREAGEGRRRGRGGGFESVRI